MAGTISIRLGLEGAVELKQQLESAGVVGGTALDKLRSGLERLNAQDSGAVVQAIQRVTQATQQAQAALGQSQANAFASVQAPTSSADYKARAADIAAYGAEMDRLRAKYDPLFAVSKKYSDQVEEIGLLEKTGVLSKAQAGVALQNLTKAYSDTATGADKATGHTGGFSLATAGATRELIVLGHEAVTGNFNRIPGSLIVMAERAGSLHGIIGGVTDFVTSMGGAFTIAGIVGVAALAAMGIAANNNASLLADLRQALRLTHDDYASLADTVDISARKAAASSLLTRVAAEDITKTIAGSRYLGDFSQELVTLTKSAADYARVAGVDGVQAGKLFRQAIDDPAAAAKALSDQGLPALDAALLRNIQNLANSGQSAEATRLVFEAIRKSTQGATQDASPLGKALHDLEQRFYGARDGGKSLAETMGGLVDSFIAFELHGLARLIDGLDGFIAKVQSAKVKAANEGNSATRTGGGGVDDFGNPYSTDSPLNPAARVSQTTTGALGQVDASIRPLIDAAAKQYQVDSELLARLQLAENAKPSGTDAAGNPIWAGSGTGAIGPMQVTGTTFRGLPGFAGQDINNPATNIGAGTSLFAKLLQKYGDPYMAVLAYHDGETLIDHVLAGDLDTRNHTYQASIEGRQEAEKVAGTYTGTGRAYTGATPALTGSLSPNDVGGLTGGVSPIRLPDSVQRLLGAGADGTQLASAQDADSKISEITRAILDLRAAGETTGPTMDRLQALLGKAREQAYGAVSPFEGLTRAAQDQIAPFQAESGAARTVADAVNQARIALQAKGQDLTDVQADQVRTDTLLKLGLTFNDNVQAIDRQIAAQDAINQTYGASGGYILDITAKTQAEAAARATAIPGTKAYADQVAILTDRNTKLAQSQLTLGSQQQNRGLSDNITYLQTEIATVGQDEAARSRLLAVLKEEQALHVKYGATTLPAEAQKTLALVAAQSDLTSAYQHQQQVLSDLTGAFSGIADTIGNDVTQAFVQGAGAGVSFKSVLQGIETQVGTLLAKLALINPLLNLLDGKERTTLGEAGGLLSNILGAGGTSVGGAASAYGVTTLQSFGLFKPLSGDTPTQTATAANSDAGAETLLSKALGAVFGPSVGSFGSLGTWLTNQVGSLASGIPGLGSAATNAALGAAGPGVYGVATVGQVGSAAVSTISSALPYLGAAVGILSSLAKGDVKSAGLTFGGAAIGTLIAPGIGTAIGAALGGVLGGLFPSHPLNPYQNVQLNVASGHLATGASVGQLEDVGSTQSGLQSYANSLNSYLDQVGIVITAADGHLGDIGDHITGLAQTLDPNTLFAKLTFKDATNDGSNFSAAKGALTGLNFNTPQDLANELAKIAGFADAASAIGIKLQSVSTDLTSIQIASVQQQAGASTTTVKNAQGSDVTYNSDIRAALQNDLVGKTFANVQALDDEINNVNTYLTNTLPQLLTPTKLTQSSVQDQIQASNVRYAAAISQDQQLGLGNTSALEGARDQAIAILMKPALDAITTSLTSIVGRGQTLLYGQAGSGQATLANLSETQRNEQSSLYDQIHQAFGDNQVATDNYNRALQSLLTTQNAETEATKQQIALAAAQSLASLTASEASYTQRAGIDNLNLQLVAYDAKATQERDEFIKSWTDYYGQASLNTQAFQDQLLVVDKAHATERLDIEKAYVGQSAAQLKTAQGSVTSLFTSIHDYAVKLQTGSTSPLSPLSQYDLAKSQFNAVSGAALAGNASSAQQLTSYADALLAASQAVNGSGTAYAADFTQVLDALQGVTNNTDALTQSFMAQQFQQSIDATNGVKDAVTSLQSEVAALRREVQTQTAALGRAA